MAVNVFASTLAAALVCAFRVDHDDDEVVAAGLETTNGSAAVPGGARPGGWYGAVPPVGCALSVTVSPSFGAGLSEAMFTSSGTGGRRAWPRRPGVGARAGEVAAGATVRQTHGAAIIDLPLLVRELTTGRPRLPTVTEEFPST